MRNLVKGLLIFTLFFCVVFLFTCFQTVDLSKNVTVRFNNKATSLNATNEDEINVPVTRVQEGLPDTLEESILKDMHRCSLAMGVSQSVLEENHDKVRQIARKASTFLSSFWEVVPKDYLLKLNNPCWYSNLTVPKDVARMLESNLGQYQNSLPKSKLPSLANKLFKQNRNPKRNSNSGKKRNLYCLPYFLLAGFPKSGTTTLHSVLTHHPQIAPPESKELHWWARIPLGDMDSNYLKIITVRYLLNFKSAASKIVKDGRKMVTYDASQTTLVDSNFNIDNEDYCAMASAVPRVLPEAKIVVIMRDPVPRVYSHFIYMHHEFSKWPKAMKTNTPLYFHTHITAAIRDFQLCLARNKSVYECANQVRTSRQELQSWIGMGIYYIQLLQWMQFWPRENFLFLKTEEMAENPFAVINNITDFLSLDPISKEDALKWFSKKQNTRKTFLKSAKYEMLPETQRLLEIFFAPFNKRLQEMIGITWSY